MDDGASDKESGFSRSEGYGGAMRGGTTTRIPARQRHRSPTVFRRH